MRAEKATPYPAPIPGKFSTDLFDCCAEPLGATGCLYYDFCSPCAAGDMAVKMSAGDIDRPVEQSDCICMGANDDWSGYPWINGYTQCFGVYCGAFSAIQQVIINVSPKTRFVP
jgi:hypothetical protein